jgi:PKD repeat protein
MKKFMCFVVCLLFIGLTLGFSGDAKGKNKSTLISHSTNEIVVTFNLDSYDFERVLTPNGEEVVVKAPHAGRIMKKGAPDLVRFSTAVIIPDQGKMAVDVVDGQFIELENVSIAPSKGNLLRTQNPDKIPYEYGKEYRKDAFFPGTLAELNNPYIIRDFRGQSVLLYPFQYNPVTGTLRVYTEMTVNVHKKGNAGENEFNRSRALRFDEIEHEFKNVYSRHFVNYDAMNQAETARASLEYTALQDPKGRMLIVCYSGFMTNMSGFVSYKQSIGYTVDLVDYSTIGSAAALKTYVANYYNTNGLTYLLLVGDHAQIPVSSTTAGDSDNNYGFIVGSDHYQDIFVGRFSAENTGHVDTQVNRTIYYERDLSSSATWFRQATGMGSSEGPGHNGEYDYQHINNILTDLANYGYTTSTNHQSGGSTANLSSLINAGKGTLWYCGHGNYDGWYCGWTFLNANVAALTNDNMLPAVFSVACQVGNFKNYTCFCEYWMRETNGSNAAGAIAHCGSTINQSWNPPMDAQDEMADILVSSSGPKRTFGGVFVNGLFKMNDLNGSAGYSMTDTWVCFGDSSVQLRTPGTPDGPGGGTPTPPTANFSGSPTTVAVGGTVNFTDTSTGSPTSWSWTFENGTPATSTARNPTVTYNTAGTFNVTLTAYNSLGSDTETKVDYITVSSTPLYCASSGSTQADEWIARVRVANLDNSSGASPYSDFTAKVANLTRGVSASVILTPGYSGTSYTEYWRIWIDYNKDGDFLDTGELVKSLRGKNARSSSFTPPTTALTGNTRMRVSMKYGAYPTSCETFTYGEVEDYTANIQ